MTEEACREARATLAASPGRLDHELQRRIEPPGQHVLLVRWQTLEHHTVGFRRSTAWQRCKALLHPLYEPVPTVTHCVEVSHGGRGPGRLKHPCPRVHGRPAG